MPAGPGAPALSQAAQSAPERGTSGPAACPPPPPPPQLPAPGPPESPALRRGAVRSSFPQKLAEALSSQYGLNVFVAGLLFLLAWAVHASGVGKRDLLCFLTALMLLQLLWMLWYVGRSSAHRRLIRHKDTYAGARWLRGESPKPRASHREPRLLARSLQPRSSSAPSPPSAFPCRLCCLRGPVHLSWLPHLPPFLLSLFFSVKPGLRSWSLLELPLHEAVDGLHWL